MLSYDCMLLAGLLQVAAVSLASSGGIAFERQSLQVPAAAGVWGGGQLAGLSDIDQDGLVDLLAVDPAENKLWIYRQRPTGFPTTPGQILQLPAQTAWLALYDVEAHPGLELVISTPTGLSYLRQNGGVFETQPHVFIQADQVFTNGTPPRLLQLNTQTEQTNASLPIISASQVVPYHRNSAGEWRPGSRLPLQAQETQWYVEQGDWSIASAPAHSLGIGESFLARSAEAAKKKDAEDIIRRLQETVSSGHRWQREDSVDIDGDGRRGLLLWRPAEGLRPKTDILVFLRGADNQFPKDPNQILHCRGIPVEVSPNPGTGRGWQRFSPLCHLADDHQCQLVLVDLKATIVSASGVLEMALSGSLEWALTIRTFNHGLFSRTPDASVPVTAMVPTEQSPSELFLLGGDFNGDRRPDLLVRRSATRWEILLSSAVGWFTPKPALSLDIPLEGFFQIQDLNHDGLADLVVKAWDEPTFLFFLSHSPSARGK